VDMISAKVGYVYIAKSINVNTIWVNKLPFSSLLYLKNTIWNRLIYIFYRKVRAPITIKTLNNSLLYSIITVAYLHLSIFLLSIAGSIVSSILVITSPTITYGVSANTTRTTTATTTTSMQKDPS